MKIPDKDPGLSIPIEADGVEISLFNLRNRWWWNHQHSWHLSSYRFGRHPSYYPASPPLGPSFHYFFHNQWRTTRSLLDEMSIVKSAWLPPQNTLSTLRGEDRKISVKSQTLFRNSYIYTHRLATWTPPICNPVKFLTFSFTRSNPAKVPSAISVTVQDTV